MSPTPFEYRFRFLLHGLIFALGFGLVPSLDGFTTGILQALGITTRSTWLIVASMLARQRLLTFSTATVLVLVLAILCMALAAWLRVWGSAYVGAAIVQSPTMHAGPLLADGPYRRTRNPLYLGTLLHTFGLAILMPPAGALFTIALIWILQLRLALAEEPFLTARYGQPYLDYIRAVPRFLPTPAAQVASAGAAPHWLQAILGELYFLGALLTLCIFGWSFNAQPLQRGILISLGVALIARAFLPKPTHNDN